MTEAAALTPVAQLPADGPDSCLHGERLDEPEQCANYLRGNSFFTLDVIAFVRQVGEINTEAR